MARTKKRTLQAAENTVIGYLRVSTQEQADSGAGLAAQRAKIIMYAKLYDLVIVDWEVDPGFSGKDLKRPGLTSALRRIRNGEAGGIIVAKVDRISRSVVDFAKLMKAAIEENWNLVSIDPGLDLKTPTGKMVAQMMALIAEWERDIIAERTRNGLAAKKAAGVQLGRRRSMPTYVLVRAVGLWMDLGGNYSEAARCLNFHEVPTPQGGKQWYPSTVRAMVLSAEGIKERERQEVFPVSPQVLDALPITPRFPMLKVLTPFTVKQLKAMAGEEVDEFDVYEGAGREQEGVAA